MRAPANSDFVAESLLRYYRNPSSTDKPALNPQDFVAYFGIVARLALGKPVAFTNQVFAAQRVSTMLRQAALLFIRRTQFRDDADHYQLLAVAPDASMQAIRENHRLLIQIVHPDRASPDAGWPDGIAARVNRAYFVLKHADSRAAYDLQRSAHAIRRPPGWAKQAAQTTAVAQRNRPPTLIVLPEWLTAGVGGFVRRNPTFTIFTVLVSGCSLAIASVMWLDPGVTLKRSDARPRLQIQPAQLPTQMPAQLPAQSSTPPTSPAGQLPVTAVADASSPADPQSAAATAVVASQPEMATDAATRVPRSTRPAP